MMLTNDMTPFQTYLETTLDTQGHPFRECAV